MVGIDRAYPEAGRHWRHLHLVADATGRDQLSRPKIHLSRRTSPESTPRTYHDEQTRHDAHRDREPVATLPAYAARVAQAFRSALARNSESRPDGLYRALQAQLVDVS